MTCSRRFAGGRPSSRLAVCRQITPVGPTPNVAACAPGRVQHGTYGRQGKAAGRETRRRLCCESANDNSPLPAASDCRGIGRLLCPDRQRPAFAARLECGYGARFAKGPNFIWLSCTLRRRPARRYQRGLSASTGGGSNRASYFTISRSAGLKSRTTFRRPTRRRPGEDQLRTQ